jgi:hypothetical protein
MPNNQLPDTSSWIPRDVATETVGLAFRNRCRAIETDILRRVAEERSSSFDNFDSGLGVEDIFRSEVSQLLPTRYSVKRGTVVDRSSKTCGDCDFVVFNEFWFPLVKGPAATGSRRAFLPIEGAYAIGEVKQTLSPKTLDEAMRKLVIAHRLERPRTFAKRTVENRESGSCRHGLSNPLYSFVVATGLEEGVTFESLVQRFFDICSSLKRLDIVRGLCVLGHGTVTWGMRDSASKGATPAAFMMEDLYRPICPVFARATTDLPALYVLICDLSLHLFHSVLAPEDIHVAYGPEDWKIVLPKTMETVIQPDPEWMESLSVICDESHETAT